MSPSIRVLMPFRGNRTPFGSELNHVTHLDLLPHDDSTDALLADRTGSPRATRAGALR